MSLNITDAIFSTAQRQPHAIAVIDTKIAVDYLTFCNGVCLAAQRFRQAGWKAGDTVGICLRDTPALHLLCVIALARMGITQVAMPASDPVTLRISRMQRLNVTGLVVDDGGIDAGHTATTVTPNASWLRPAQENAPAEDIRAPGGDRHWIINETSGTTATPKLIGVSHAAEDMHRRRVSPIFAHLPGERFLNLTGLRFLTALKRAICCLSDGATITFAPANLSTAQLLNWIDRHHVTYISCVPLHLQYLVRDIRTGSPRLPSVRILRSSSSALPLSIIQAIRRRITPNLYINYGISEAGPIVAATPAMLDSNPDTVGLPLEGVELDIVDDNGNPVACGTLGHVRVRGPGIETAYLHTPEPAQTQAFRDGWFYPGDIAVIDSDGLVFLKGRSDEVMNFDGILVGPAEIESVLRRHPAVKDVAAFALPSAAHQDIPAAAIVSDQPLPLNELQRFCAERLGVRAPRQFFQFDEIPKNPAGKILRRRVTELAIERLKKTPRP